MNPHNVSGERCDHVEITERVEVGENDHGYRFAVGRLESGRWVGFADSDYGAFIFPGMATGCEIGTADRERAIRLTGAIAQSIEHGYGGVARWFVEDALRGKPEDFTCEECGEVGCCCGECLEGDDDSGV